jgi:4-hydroxy-tetrahydrodipicolinate reductase
MKKNVPIRVAVAGAAGKMGRILLQLILRDKNLELVGAFDQKGNAAIGQDVGLLIGGGVRGIRVADSPEGAIAKAQVVIDFTSPRATLHDLKVSAKYRKAVVIGTTGFTAKEKQIIKQYARRIPIVFSPNMSLGVNLLFKLAFLLGASLSPDYDVEIIEAHHRHKKDAPSGTALEFANRVAEGRKIDLGSYALYGRKGLTGAREKGTICIHAIRGGDVVGEHTVAFLADGERIELTHKATSREAFARGSLYAARYLKRQKPGLYDMGQVLALH